MQLWLEKDKVGKKQEMAKANAPLFYLEREELGFQ